MIFKSCFHPFRKMILVCLSVFGLIPGYAQPHAFITDSLDAYINKGLSDWQLPGLALLIIKDGKIIVMKGYGVRDLASRAAVDENTLFMIASNTKLFTGTALAQLAFDKKLSLDDNIRKYYPEYALYDKTNTELLSIRDLLSHRIGTKAFQGDFTFWNSLLSRTQVMEKMRLLKPVGVFRQDFGYCNSCFLAAGQVIPKVTGSTWEKYIADSILTPLEMTHTRVLSDGYNEIENASKPYSSSFFADLKPVPADNWDNLAPAASMVSSISDLSHWVMFQLDSGWFRGRQVMPFDILQETRKLNTFVNSRKSMTLPSHIAGYGLGVFSADYNGRQIFWHTGGAAGMLSVICFVPEEKLGIVVLSNNDNQNFYMALRNQILDAFLDMPWINRSEQLLKKFKAERARTLSEISDWKSRTKKSAAPLPLHSYTGHYTNKLYGSIDIRLQNDELKIHFNGHSALEATLEYMDHDQWLLQYNNPEYGIFTTSFHMNAQHKTSISIKANDFVEYDPYEFTRNQ